ncbi:MAG: hypothetical protein ACLRXQ_08535 [Phascolarctobacterium faecium]
MANESVYGLGGAVWIRYQSCYAWLKLYRPVEFNNTFNAIPAGAFWRI